MSFTRTILICCSLVVIASLSHAKEWHGIVPLHSTRADVERILGPAKDPSKEHVSRHETENEVVLVEYATGPPCGISGSSMWQVPRGTVVGMTVSPKRELPFSDLHLDKSNYKVTDGGHVPGYTYYTDEREGVQIEVTRGLVMSTTYFPRAKDGYLRCPGPRNKQNDPCRCQH